MIVTAIRRAIKQKAVGRAGIEKDAGTVSCAVDRHCTESAAKQGTRADPLPAIARFKQRIEDELGNGKRKATVAKESEQFNGGHHRPRKI